MLLKVWLYVDETFSQLIKMGIIDKMNFEYLVGIIMRKFIKKEQKSVFGDK